MRKSWSNGSMGRTGDMLQEKYVDEGGSVWWIMWTGAPIHQHHPRTMNSGSKSEDRGSTKYVLPATQQVDRNRIWPGVGYEQHNVLQGASFSLMVVHSHFLLPHWGSFSCLSCHGQSSGLCDRSHLCKYNYKTFSQPQTTTNTLFLYCKICDKDKNLSSLVTPWGA
jgi:hypothetical protein